MTATLSLTTADVAKRWHIDRKTVLKMVREGQLTGTQLGPRIWRFSEDEIAAYEQDNHSQARGTDADIAS